MSEEEIIEILEDRDMLIDTLFENYRQSIVKPFDNAIQGLLDLYTKQKEEIEELKKYYASRKEVEELENTIKCLHETDKEFISKDIIRNKIKELGEIRDNIFLKNGMNEEYYKNIEQVKVLKELLGE